MKKFSKVFQNKPSNVLEENHEESNEKINDVNDVNLQEHQMQSNVQNNFQCYESGDVNQAELESESGKASKNMKQSGDMKEEFESTKDLTDKLQQEQSSNERLLKENESLKSLVQEQNNFFSKKENEVAAALSEVEKWKSYAAQIKSEMDSIIVRNEKSIAEIKEYSVTKFAKDILVVVDSFEKAIESMQGEGSQKEADQRERIKEDIGISVIMKELLGVLKSHGVSQVDSDRVEFDPALHMAVSQEKDDNMPSNYIVKTLRKGYKIGDRCLREALVVVNDLS